MSPLSWLVRTYLVVVGVVEPQRLGVLRQTHCAVQLIADFTQTLEAAVRVGTELVTEAPALTLVKVCRKHGQIRLRFHAARATVVTKKSQTMSQKLIMKDRQLCNPVSMCVYMTKRNLRVVSV